MGQRREITLTFPFDFDIARLTRTKNFRRKTASIAKGRWAAYATAGAASALCASSAEATIHYSGPIHRYSEWQWTRAFRFRLDQPGDSIHFRHYVTAFTTSGSGRFGVYGIAGKGFAGFYCPSNPRVGVVSKLNLGDFISRRPFLAKETFGVLGQDIHNSCPGQFEDDTFGFIGFKFNGGSGDQYGWGRIKLDFRSSFWVVDYAYADPGEPIKAGQTSSNEMVPEEGSLGWLARGAAGLLAWRKSRSRSAGLGPTFG